MFRQATTILLVSIAISVIPIVVRLAMLIWWHTPVRATTSPTFWVISTPFPTTSCRRIYVSTWRIKRYPQTENFFPGHRQKFEFVSRCLGIFALWSSLIYVSFGISDVLALSVEFFRWMCFQRWMIFRRLVFPIEYTMCCLDGTTAKNGERIVRAKEKRAERQVSFFFLLWLGGFDGSC